MHCSFYLTKNHFHLIYRVLLLGFPGSRDVDILPRLFQTKAVHILYIFPLYIYILLLIIEKHTCFKGILYILLRIYQY
jgi:hypothetical protein